MLIPGPPGQPGKDGKDGKNGEDAEVVVRVLVLSEQSSVIQTVSNEDDSAENIFTSAPLPENVVSVFIEFTRFQGDESPNVRIFGGDVSNGLEYSIGNVSWLIGDHQLIPIYTPSLGKAFVSKPETVLPCRLRFRLKAGSGCTISDTGERWKYYKVSDPEQLPEIDVT